MGFLFKLSLIIFILALITFVFSYYLKNNSSLKEIQVLNQPGLNYSSEITQNNKVDDNLNNQNNTLTFSPGQIKILNPVEEKRKRVNGDQNNLKTNLTESATETEENFEEIKEIIIEAIEFKFEPNIFRVKEGQQVKLIIKNKGKVPHNFKIEKENVVFQTSLIAPGEESILEFKAPTKGEYDFYSTLSDYKLRGMFGKMVVE
ncbi:MAG: cupredoxin domain-containing protein [Patescibacteria group bacterium]|nr:cupredoxin domain-containing protein [Patescibacteria group bacterium]